MKVLVFGATGFIGRNVVEVLSAKHEVFGAAVNPEPGTGFYDVNLLDKKSITQLINKLRPQVIINCAGIVENSEAAMQNLAFTTNVLQSVVESGHAPKRIVICGSAAEYGVVDEKSIPVKEDTPLNAKSGYGLSKLKETVFALKFAKTHTLPVVIARIFNPVGPGMHPRLLIPKIISQINEIEAGKRHTLEVDRLESRRDYVNIKDVARAIADIAENNPEQKAYNIGSGKSTSNAELIDFIVENSGLPIQPKIIETAAEPEPLVAIQADISRMENEFNWKPLNSIEESLKEIIDATRQ